MAQIINNNTRPGTDASVITYTPDFNGVNSTIDVPHWGPTGDWRISFDYYLADAPTTNSTFVSFQNAISNGNYIYIRLSSGSTSQVAILGSGVASGSVTNNAGAVGKNTIKWTCLGTTHTLNLNGTEVSGTVTGLEALTITRIGYLNGFSLYLDDLMYNLHLEDLGDPSNSRFYPLSLPSTSGAIPGSTTIQDTLSPGNTNQGTPANFGNWIAKP